MKKPALPENESTRIQTLADLAILDTEAEKSFDDITYLTAQICQTPIAVISFVDTQRQWFKSKYGLGVLETPREFAFCAHAIHSPELCQVSDATKDERFMDNPLVNNDPHVIFYAGQPIEIDPGVRLGTLAVIDHHPKSLSQDQKVALKILAGQVESQLKLRRSAQHLLLAEQTASNALNKQILFLEEINHEIRTPLHAIIGYSQLIAEADLSPKHSKWLNTIHDSANHILSQLTAKSTYEPQNNQRSTKPNKQAFHLESFIDSTLKMIDLKAKARGISLTAQFYNIAPLVRGEEEKIRQILLKLLNFCVHHTDSKQIQLTCSTKHKIPHGQEGTFFLVSCIPRSHKEALIESKTTQPQLEEEEYSIDRIRYLASTLNGTLTTVSHIVEGVNYLLSLPLEYLNEEPSLEVTVNNKPAQEMSILVVDDLEVNQQLLSQRLAYMGASKVMTAASGEEAIDLAANHKFDIIFMDVRMPGIGGLQATSSLRSHGFKGKIIGLSAGASAAEQQACYKAGMDDFIPKPASKQKIHQVIYKIAQEIRLTSG